MNNWLLVSVVAVAINIVFVVLLVVVLRDNRRLLRELCTLQSRIELEKRLKAKDEIHHS